MLHKNIHFMQKKLLKEEERNKTGDIWRTKGKMANIQLYQ